MVPSIANANSSSVRCPQVDMIFCDSKKSNSCFVNPFSVDLHASRPKTVIANNAMVLMVVLLKHNAQLRGDNTWAKIRNEVTQPMC